MNNDYIVSWFDTDGNEWFGEWIGYEEALKQFYSISGKEENKVDYNQISSELWSDADNKIILRYDYTTNKYYKM